MKKYYTPTKASKYTYKHTNNKKKEDNDTMAITETVSLDYVWIATMFFTYIVAQQERKWIWRLLTFTMLFTFSIFGFFVKDGLITIPFIIITMFLLVKEVVGYVEFKVEKQKKGNT